jgi:hypothetical protein
MGLKGLRVEQGVVLLFLLPALRARVRVVLSIAPGVRTPAAAFLLAYAHLRHDVEKARNIRRVPLWLC